MKRISLRIRFKTAEDIKQEFTEDNGVGLGAPIARWVTIAISHPLQGKHRMSLRCRKGWRPLRVRIALREKSSGVLVRTRATPNGHYNRDPNG